MYVICDHEGTLVHFIGVEVRGCKVNLYACFTDEQEALDVAFILEDKGLLPRNCKVVGCEHFVIEEPK